MRTVEVKMSAYIHIKRCFDFVTALIALIVLSPVFMIIAVLVRVKLGSPVIFKQKRPGLGNRIVEYHKFRSMTNQRDENGNLLPDNIRLTGFGKVLRSTSLDELPQLWDILIGRMSLIGPRPHLVRDMLFYTEDQLRRQSVMPGLSGWAQINGRDDLPIPVKVEFDAEYLKKRSFWFDMKIIWLTFIKVIRRDNVDH